MSTDVSAGAGAWSVDARTTDTTMIEGLVADRFQILDPRQ